MEDTNLNKMINLVIKWSGKEFKISEFDTNYTVLSLKQAIQNVTGVLPERQKLLNIKFRGKPADDTLIISSLNLKDGFKIMMMGSLEESIAQLNTPQEPNDVVNDLDLPDEELTVDNSIYISKIEKRIATYKINILNPPRNDRKLVVLDIDYTIFDHRSTAEQPVELMRPYLHEFLTTLYPYYDIMFWSATSMKWILEKLKLLGVTNHPDYKIVCHLDSAAMISVNSSPKHELVDVKPLQVIWGKFPQFTPMNTVMLDDIRHNFIMNKQSGLRIRAFRQAHFNRYKDKELFFLAKYLKYIAKKQIDFTTLNHRKWESFIANAKDLDQILFEDEDDTSSTVVSAQEESNSSNNTAAGD